MAKFKLTNNAVKDLSDIWSYTVETWSESHQISTYYKLIELGLGKHLNISIG